MTMDAASTVAELACLTESRSKAEHQALVAVAERVDRERNRQSARNPRLDGRPLGPCACPGDYDKKCVCCGEGTAIEPNGGWSWLSA